MKKTAVAPSNIAFIKYWGKKDEALKLPMNGSISMNLSHLLTTTTVEFDEKYSQDEITINGETQGHTRLREHLDRIRTRAGIKTYAKVESVNNFPASTGLSSSASGFAALTVAAIHAAGLSLSEKELSILARQGSGSAARSIPDGFVEWYAADTSDHSFAESIFPKNHWDIKDIVCILSKEKKYLPTSEGMKDVTTNKLFEHRLKSLPMKLELCRDLIQKKDFKNFGELIEQEALELDSIFMSSDPPLTYVLPQTREMMKLVQKWRGEGLSVYFTFNTGQNIHLITEKEHEEKVLEKLKDGEFVQEVISNSAGEGAHLTDNHLF